MFWRSSAIRFRCARQFAGVMGGYREPARITDLSDGTQKRKSKTANGAAERGGRRVKRSPFLVCCLLMACCGAVSPASTCNAIAVDPSDPEPVQLATIDLARYLGHARGSEARLINPED